MTTENKITIKVIVELESKPGKRAELKSLLESVVAKYGQSHPGLLESTRYEVLDNPNILVEIADWTSAEYGRRLCRMRWPQALTHRWKSY